MQLIQGLEVEILDEKNNEMKYVVSGVLSEEKQIIICPKCKNMHNISTINESQSFIVDFANEPVDKKSIIFSKVIIAADKKIKKSAKKKLDSGCYICLAQEN